MEFEFAMPIKMAFTEVFSGFSLFGNKTVVAKRFTKRQQMQWSPEGAHLLLQMRTRVLNGELEQIFRDWHPGFRAANDEKLKKVARFCMLSTLNFFHSKSSVS